MNKEEIVKYFRIGGYLRKFNFEPFSLKGHLLVAFIKIKKVRIGTNKVIINDIHFQLSENLPVRISKEYALELQSEWEETKHEINDLQESKNKDFEHFREDNGEPKRPLNRALARKILFKQRHMNPSGLYEAYICSHCNEIHTGKTKDLVAES